MAGSPDEPDTDQDSTDTSAEASETGSVRGEVTKLHAGPKRRALELRVARRRQSTDAEEEEPVADKAEGPRGKRGPAATGPRNGPRAQQRAARAAQAEEDNKALAESDDLDEDDDLDGPTADAETDEQPDEVVAQAPVIAEGTVLTPGVIADEDDDADDRPGPGRRRGGKRGRGNNNANNRNDASHYVVAPTVNAATMKPRHYGVMALFVLMVLLPTLSYSVYLWTRAVDQYESDVGFGSRTEDGPSTFDFLGALGGVSQSSSKDMDILNQFIISQELVSKVDQQLDLKRIYGKAINDPLNALGQNVTIEDKVAYWQRMVRVNYDTGTGLMNLQIYAFDPKDAQDIANAVLVESTRIINDLSKTAQEDATRYSQDSLHATEKKLSDARLAVLDFQITNHVVDPSSAIANQSSIVGTLNQQLAAAQIDLDMLTGTVQPTDPRLAQLSRRIDVINNRISEEQSKVGALANSSAPGFAKMMSDFERLRVDQEFAEKAYLSSLAAYDQALTDAQHKTRYLATYVAPTLAEAPTAPNRPLTAFIVALIGFLLWSVLVLVYYALRDRR